MIEVRELTDAEYSDQELFETKTGRGLEVYHMYRKLALDKAA